MQTMEELAEYISRLEQENVELKKALEASCKFMAQGRSCPIGCQSDSTLKCGEKKCIKMLTKYFKEVAK